MSNHPHSPADVLRHALVSGGMGVLPSIATPGTPLIWPMYVGRLPNKPDNIIGVYNTAGVKQGRYMRTGESLFSNGWQIRIRAVSHIDAWNKAKDIQKHLDTIRQFGVIIETSKYIITSVTQIGSPIPMGQGRESKRREGIRRDNISMNGTLTIKEI